MGERGKQKASKAKNAKKKRKTSIARGDVAPCKRKETASKNMFHVIAKRPPHTLPFVSAPDMVTAARAYARQKKSIDPKRY